MSGLADRGVAIWMISSDMEEVLHISGRIAVMDEGRITGELPRAEFSEKPYRVESDPSGFRITGRPKQIFIGEDFTLVENQHS